MKMFSRSQGDYLLTSSKTTRSLYSLRLGQSTLGLTDIPMNKKMRYKDR